MEDWKFQWRRNAARQQAEIRQLTIEEKLDGLDRLMSTIPCEKAKADRQRRVDETRRQMGETETSG